MEHSEWIKQKEKDIKEHPENHLHDYNELLSCCIFNGALDLSIMDLHSQYIDLGTNGGTKCDVIDGPCSCGAWHKKEDKIKKVTESIKRQKRFNRFELLDI